MKSEKTADELSLKNFSKKFTAEFLSFDKRIFKTLRALFFKPGELAASYFSAQKETFLPPLKLYFTINLIFFLFVPILNSQNFQLFNFSMEKIVGKNQTYQKIINKEIANADVSAEIYAERFNANLKYNQPALVFLIIPFFAFILWGANFRKRRFYSENLIFSLHFLSFFLVFLLIIIATYRFFRLVLGSLHVSSGVFSQIIFIITMATPIVYLFVSLRKFYKNKIFPAIVRSILLFIAFFLVIGVYVQFLFFYTLLTLRWGY